MQVLCSKWGADVDPINHGGGVLSRFSDRCDIEVTISGIARKLTKQIYMLHFYVLEAGDRRLVRIDAVGHSTAAKIWYGTRDTINMSESIKRQAEIISVLKQ